MLPAVRELRRAALQSAAEPYRHILERLAGQSPQPTTVEGLPLQAGEAVVTGGSLGLASGRGEEIARLALSLQGTPNTNYYQDPDVACASFVSTVLIRAGILARREFSTWCPSLAGVLQSHGAQQVLPMHTPISPGAISRLQPGDILLYTNGTSRYKHTEVYVGGGRTVGTSSSQDRVLSKALLTYPSWRFIAAYRF